MIRVTRLPCTRRRPASRVPSQTSPSDVSAMEMTKEEVGMVLADAIVVTLPPR